MAHGDSLGNMKTNEELTVIKSFISAYGKAVSLLMPRSEAGLGVGVEEGGLTVRDSTAQALFFQLFFFSLSFASTSQHHNMFTQL